MERNRTIPALLVTALVSLGACGGDDGAETTDLDTTGTEVTTDPAMAPAAPPPGMGTNMPADTMMGTMPADTMGMGTTTPTDTVAPY